MDNQITEQILITESAASKVYDLMMDQGDPNIKLRIFVQGGGCSGFSYGFTFDTDKQEDDFEFTKQKNGYDINFLVDSMSMQYLVGATIDYKEELMRSEFVIQNPNATTTCGCGSSFSV